ncbi:hypothetical protein [Photobacterium leiognathi]|uniref:hypothetical protein n=1 Tax=Photobacterium leiognathi TaxID=553611 RepID=UPI00298232A0|nr:hypothetical protein [Photobacterium leiognathi]
MKRLLSNYSFLIPLITLSSGCFADQPSNINFNGYILTTATPVKWALVTASMHFDPLNEKNGKKQPDNSYVFDDVKGKTDLNQTTSDSTYLAAAVLPSSTLDDSTPANFEPTITFKAGTEILNFNSKIEKNSAPFIINDSINGVKISYAANSITSERRYLFLAKKKTSVISGHVGEGDGSYEISDIWKLTNWQNKILAVINSGNTNGWVTPGDKVKDQYVAGDWTKNDIQTEIIQYAAHNTQLNIDQKDFAGLQTFKFSNPTITASSDAKSHNGRINYQATMTVGISYV